MLGGLDKLGLKLINIKVLISIPSPCLDIYDKAWDMSVWKIRRDPNQEEDDWRSPPLETVYRDQLVPCGLTVNSTIWTVGYNDVNGSVVKNQEEFLECWTGFYWCLTPTKRSDIAYGNDDTVSLGGYVELLIYC